MNIEPGKIYLLRDGTHAGPAELVHGQVREWKIGDNFYSDDGTCTTGAPEVKDVIDVYRELKMEKKK